MSTNRKRSKHARAPTGWRGKHVPPDRECRDGAAPHSSDSWLPPRKEVFSNFYRGPLNDVIDEYYKFMFCAIPKNAKSLWLGLFRRMRLPDSTDYNLIDGVAIHEIHRYGVKLAAWLEEDERKKILTDPELIR